MIVILTITVLVLVLLAGAVAYIASVASPEKRDRDVRILELERGKNIGTRVRPEPRGRRRRIDQGVVVQVVGVRVMDPQLKDVVRRLVAERIVPRECQDHLAQTPAEEQGDNGEEQAAAQPGAKPNPPLPGILDALPRTPPPGETDRTEG